MSSFSASPASSLAFQLQSVKVQLIWKSRWSPVKFLFLFSRYNMFVATIPILILTLGSDIPSNTCKKINLASAVFGVTSVAIAEGILVLRTIAIWSGSKKSCRCLVCLYMVIIVTMLVSTFIYVHSLVFVPEQELLGCNPMTRPDSVIYALIIISCVIFHETVLLTLLLYRINVYHRHTTNPILQTLYRDGIGFYLCILGKTRTCTNSC
ncbi:hypothetical protein SERLADRAFT_414286 [Serpula lacrymans var. lacrymans S7.9]|uniref:DUF6533 domain-containing protein n=1 Tax=Serpula lacrymans var. lacrymans (strain S7.9) TaxID=578457 RepID=F8NQG6_SERL9|nr:uncharacterized protein SERLADRAFT_414286 [Serpula lacrymans var. lacrymans S7.9]EGO26096.1 hypothetical protein SERLADRAFT_414286 [Serpula lacrymans var. lacrymans S7.9]